MRSCELVAVVVVCLVGCQPNVIEDRSDDRIPVGDDLPRGPGCTADGVCAAHCAEGTDPDCVPDLCGADGHCESRCADDPDCEEDLDCDEDGHCESECGDDPDCAGMDCSDNGVCSTVCPEGWDPDCELPSCEADGRCEPRCPSGTDPDCGAPACDGDRWCNPECPFGADPDCATAPECGWDGYCEPTCPYGADPDCGTGACGSTDESCCTGGASECEAGLMCVSLDSATTMCLPSCTPSTCEAGGETGACMELFTSSGVCTTSAMIPASCTPGSTSCETEYGVSTGTTCIGDGFEAYCLETCTLDVTGCAIGRACVPFVGTATAGACIPVG